MDSDKVAALVKNTDDPESINEDALDKLLSLDAERVSKLKGKGITTSLVLPA